MSENVVKWTNFEDWEFVVSSGNFLIKRYDDEELSYFAVKSAIGNWAQVYRNDHPIHYIIESFINTEDEHTGDILDMLMTLNYTMSSIAPDAIFVEEFSKSLLSLQERVDNFEKDNAEKTDEEILEEDKEIEEAKEQFDKLYDETMND